MGADFDETTLGRLLSFANGRSSPERADGLPYWVYGSNGIIGYCAETNAAAGSIVIGRVGSYCGSLQFSEQPCWVTDNAIRATARDDNDSRFLFYLLTTLDLNSWRGGSGQPLLNQDILSRIPTVAPPPMEQRAIAHVLGTLDDKIELNRRMNETLEAMARALFKSWFVDFDAARAKAEGRDPGLSKLLADLFPDSFEDSELGEIPTGWKVEPLAGLFEIGLGGTWGKDSRTSKETVPVRCLRGIDCHDLAEGRLPDVPIRWLTAEQAKARRLDDGVILVEGSGSFCGRSLLWSSSYERLLGETVIYSNFCKRLDPTCTPAEAAVCWQFMRRAFREGGIQSYRTGTAFPNLDVHSVLANLLVSVPPEPIAHKFSEFFALSRRLELTEQSRTLAALRNTLLPKLISGELRV